MWQSSAYFRIYIYVAVVTFRQDTSGKKKERKENAQEHCFGEVNTWHVHDTTTNFYLCGSVCYK